MVHNIISLFWKWITHSLILFQEKQQLPRNTHQKFSTISFYTCKEIAITKNILFGIDMLGLRLWISRNWIDTQSKEIVNIRSIQSILYKCVIKSNDIRLYSQQWMVYYNIYEYTFLPIYTVNPYNMTFSIWVAFSSSRPVFYSIWNELGLRCVVWNFWAKRKSALLLFNIIPTGRSL